MRIGITGAAGFIGAALAARALEEGHEVVGLDKVARAPAVYDRPGARYVVGDIGDLDGMRRFCDGLDRVVHTAAIVRERGEITDFVRVNVLGADTVALAARDAGVRELVHFSSVMVHGFDYPDGIAEDGRLDPADNPYCTTKILSEECVMRHHAPGRFDVYIVRPGDVYGPGSVPWTRRPVEMMRNRTWLYVDSRRAVINHVYIDNLLDGVEVILGARASGTPFAITDGVRTTVRAFFSRYQRLLGIGFLPEVPRAVALPVSALAGRALAALGRPADINRDAVRYLLRTGVIGIGKIEALGYRPKVALDEGMARCGEWLRGEGLLG